MNLLNESLQQSNLTIQKKNNKEPNCKTLELMKTINLVSTVKPNTENKKLTPFDVDQKNLETKKEETDRQLNNTSKKQLKLTKSKQVIQEEIPFDIDLKKEQTKKEETDRQLNNTSKKQLKLTKQKQVIQEEIPFDIDQKKDETDRQLNTTNEKFLNLTKKQQLTEVQNQNNNQNNNNSYTMQQNKKQNPFDEFQEIDKQLNSQNKNLLNLKELQQHQRANNQLKKKQQNVFPEVNNSHSQPKETKLQSTQRYSLSRQVPKEHLNSHQLPKELIDFEKEFFDLPQISTKRPNVYRKQIYAPTFKSEQQKSSFQLEQPSSVIQSSPSLISQIKKQIKTQNENNSIRKSNSDMNSPQLIKNQKMRLYTQLEEKAVFPKWADLEQYSISTRINQLPVLQKIFKSYSNQANQIKYQNLCQFLNDFEIQKFNQAFFTKKYFKTLFDKNTVEDNGLRWNEFQGFIHKIAESLQTKEENLSLKEKEQKLLGYVCMKFFQLQEKEKLPRNIQNSQFYSPIKIFPKNSQFVNCFYCLIKLFLGK